MRKDKWIALIITAVITAAAVLCLVLFLHRNDPPPAGPAQAQATPPVSVESAESHEKT